MNQINKPKFKPTAVLLAVFLNFWTWMYTWNKDWKKWLIGGLLFCILIWTIIVPIGVWIWAIVDRATKPKSWYEKYRIGG